MAVMTVVILAQVGLDWTGGSTATGTEKATAITQLLTAIGVGWGISWIPYSCSLATLSIAFVPPAGR